MLTSMQPSHLCASQDAKKVLQPLDPICSNPNVYSYAMESIAHLNGQHGDMYVVYVNSITQGRALSCSRHLGLVMQIPRHIEK